MLYTFTERQVVYMNHVITIGRELGSGGRTVGKEVAKRLEVPYYDRELIDEAAKESGLSADFIENNEQEITSSFLYNLAMGNSYTYGMLGLGGTNSMPLTMQVFLAQQKVIQKYAASPCVIVGRCADYILKEYKPFRIFVYADIDSKIKRCREKGPEHENLTDRELKQKISGMDKKRAKYYELYTGHSWGDKLNFDLCINTSRTVIKEIVPAVAKLLV